MACRPPLIKSRNDAAAAAAIDRGDHVLGSKFIASDYRYVSAAGGQGDGPTDPARRARDESGSTCWIRICRPIATGLRDPLTHDNWVVNLRIVVK